MTLVEAVIAVLGIVPFLLAAVRWRRLAEVEREAELRFEREVEGPRRRPRPSGCDCPLCVRRRSREAYRRARRSGESFQDARKAANGVLSAAMKRARRS